jgi:hypothetical protein
MFVQLSTIISILSISSLVSAHGKVASVTGDAGGNGTALGIIGGVVPGAGSNDVTEIDTTVFKKRKIATNGLGRTMNGGKNKAAMVHAAMAQSGDTLPQVSDGGYITGSFHIVTTVSDIRVWNKRLDRFLIFYRMAQAQSQQSSTPMLKGNFPRASKPKLLNVRIPSPLSPFILTTTNENQRSQARKETLKPVEKSPELSSAWAL